MTNLQALVVFNSVVLGLLALDLGVFNRRPHVISFREAMVGSSVWVALALAFNIGLYVWRGPEPALQFLAGYLLEKSLSVDNLFLFSVIFSSAAVPAKHQHKVLLWGVLGALMTRGALIATGVALIVRFHWLLYFFGGFLVFTGAKMIRARRGEIRSERNPLLRLARKIFRFTDQYEGASFFVRKNGQLFATPLFLVVVVVETVDVLLALDSIPAIFAVTEDPFIIYTSNVLALLGLRAIYFLLAGAITKFRYLRPGLSLTMIFVGLKMLLAPFYRVSTPVSLVIICSIPAIAIFLSARAGEKSKPRVLIRKE